MNQFQKDKSCESEEKYKETMFKFFFYIVVMGDFGPKGISWHLVQIKMTKSRKEYDTVQKWQRTKMGLERRG